MGVLRQGYDASRTLVFVHVVKNAGTSFTSAIARAIKTQPNIRGFDRLLFGSFSDFASIRPEISQTIWQSNQGFRQNHERFVACHMGLTTLRRAFPEAQFITTLREPLARLLSHWLFWRTIPEDQLEKWGKPWSERLKLARLPLSDFLSEPRIAAQTDNLQLRTLLWPHHLVPVDDFIDSTDDQDLLSLAIPRLRAFDFVGVIEEPALETRLSQWLNRSVSLPRRNEGRELPEDIRPDNAEISAAGDLLAARSRLDTALWKAALSDDVDPDDFHRTTSLECMVRVRERLSGRSHRHLQE
jgi:hypothetical protein